MVSSLNLTIFLIFAFLGRLAPSFKVWKSLCVFIAFSTYKYLVHLPTEQVLVYLVPSSEDGELQLPVLLDKAVQTVLLWRVSFWTVSGFLNACWIGCRRIRYEQKEQSCNSSLFGFQTPIYELVQKLKKYRLFYIHFILLSTCWPNNINSKTANLRIFVSKSL